MAAHAVYQALDAAEPECERLVASCIHNEAVDTVCHPIAHRDQTQDCRRIHALSSQCVQCVFWLLWSTPCIQMYLGRRLITDVDACQDENCVSVPLPHADSALLSE